MKPSALSRQRSGIATALLLFVVSLVAACDNDPPTMLGAWQLLAIDDDTLPALAFAAGDDTTEVIEEVLMLEAGGVYQHEWVHYIVMDGFRDTVGLGTVGEWERDGNTIWLEPAPALRDRLFLLNGELRNITDAGTWRYHRVREAAE